MVYYEIDHQRSLLSEFFMSINRYNMDMCNGPLLNKMIRYAIPLAITYILQLAFHAADLIIIGNFGSYESMASIGTTADLINLTVNMLVGISIGANVLAAQYYGAKDRINLSRTIHSAMAFAIVGGIAIALLGIALCVPSLKMIHVPDEILPKSALYMRIVFCGLPFSMIYNFGCSILRAGGDTRRPLYFLIAAGIVNVGLNLIFVALFKWDVAGVAIATVISQGLSAYLVIRAMTASRGASRLILKNLRFDWPALRKLLAYGVPAGVQGIFFSVSNIIIQGAINTFGAQAMAGMTATVCLEWLLYSAVHSSQQTVIVFAGQNFGAKKIKRIMRCLWIGFAGSVLMGIVLGGLMTAGGNMLMGLFNSDPAVAEWGLRRIKIVFTTYFLCGLADVSAGALRSLGHSMIPTVSALICACGFRILWIKTAFAASPTIETLVLAYPLSWTLWAIVNGIFLYWFCRKLLHEDEASRHYAFLSSK